MKCAGGIHAFVSTKQRLYIYVKGNGMISSMCLCLSSSDLINDNKSNKNGEELPKLNSTEPLVMSIPTVGYNSSP